VWWSLACKLGHLFCICHGSVYSQKYNELLKQSLTVDIFPSFLALICLWQYQIVTRATAISNTNILVRRNIECRTKPTKNTLELAQYMLLSYARMSITSQYSIKATKSRIIQTVSTMRYTNKRSIKKQEQYPASVLMVLKITCLFTYLLTQWLCSLSSAITWNLSAATRVTSMKNLSTAEFSFTVLYKIWHVLSHLKMLKI